ncbi:acetylornithine deacetylase-like protein [Clathrospora elynae]|uniref:Acetylornithine deacetylase-like protein n=1 Tax=Clathrospora elynae TaxID=706981 RepID=A0A6A5T834_9PLEO|nr:acetylornithine deacetylase-like protein [Clathrospora elynae]
MAIITSILSVFFLALISAAPQAPVALSAVSSAVPTPSASNQSTTLTTKEIDEIFNLHEDLVNIPSISNDEVKCAEFLSEYLTELGYYVEKVPVGDTGTYDVFAYPQALKDEGFWPEVLVTSHIDTVSPFYPFERREENGTVYHYGRGTVDAKGPIATMIIATHKFAQSRTETPSLGMLFVVGEEIGGTGMKAFASYAQNTTFRAGVFGEPTQGKLASGHKGSLRLVFEVKGKSAHSEYPWLGVSAINYLAEAIVALNMLEPALPRSELLDATTLNVGLIAGGLAGNVVPDIANASIVVRIARSEDDAVSVVQDMISGILSPVVARAGAANATLDIVFSNTTYPAPILDTDVEGLEVAHVFFRTDIPSLTQVGKRYLLGPRTIEVAHTPVEGLSQEELVQAAEAYGFILESLFARE